MKENHVVPRWSTVLFDLDGTLIDSSRGIRKALTTALDLIAGPGGPDDADLSLPLDAMIRSVRPAATDAEASLMAQVFRRHYDTVGWRAAELYPGALDCIRSLDAAGVRCYVVTNKRHGPAVRLLGYFQLTPYLHAIIGQSDTGEPVSKAELAGQLLEFEGVDPRTAVVVGDSDHDQTMATAWAMQFIALQSGAGPLSPAEITQERVEVPSLVEVARIVLGEPIGGSLE